MEMVYNGSFANAQTSERKRTYMRSISDELPFWNRLLSMLEAQFGDQCELVLHDLTRDYSETIVDIRNGNITGRKIGDCGSNLGLEVMRGTVKNGDRYNYITHTLNGKILRSSTIYLHNDDNELCGALCINLDITNTMTFETFLRKYNDFSLEKEEPREIFATDVKSLLEYLIKEAHSLVGKEPREMDKADKIRFLDYLDKKGAFLVTKSSERVCEFLEISKFTLYNYLDLARNAESTLPPPGGRDEPANRDRNGA